MDEERSFRVGDLVKVLPAPEGADGDWQPVSGLCGTVRKVRTGRAGELPIGVWFPGYRGHSLKGLTPDDDGWWCDPAWLRCVSEESQDALPVDKVCGQRPVRGSGICEDCHLEHFSQQYCDGCSMWLCLACHDDHNETACPAPAPATTPKLYSVALQALVTVRVRDVEAASQAEGLAKAEALVNMNTLFQHTSLPEGVRHIEYADELPYALVDEVGDAEHEHSRWYDWRDGWRLI